MTIDRTPLGERPARNLERICIYCASSMGNDPLYRQLATDVGTLLAQNDIEVVYGGGAVGLMGAVADAAMAAGGRVIGVIPVGLFSREVGHDEITELVEVSSMHERKQMMFDLSDAFVALPGGLGTLEELAEVATWSQLQVHDKPIAVLNWRGFFDPLLEWLDRAVDAGLMKAANRDIIASVDQPADLLDTLRTYQRAAVPKWID
ncbi:MAG: TIGR00730 family Rossman fold protein [Acidimicrobiales bacterium]|nr:TIGR00730 family Rossman fold protein [Acidimicrobiales bacterium]